MTDDVRAETADAHDTSTKRSGRKRAVLAAGALLGVGALATAAAFTDFAMLNLGGSGGGFGGDANKYNIQVSTKAVDHLTDLADADWIEANPDAEDIVIPGADSLVPGGQPVVAKIPVRNASTTMRSDLALSLENTTTVTGDGAADARNAAYAGLMKVEVAMVDDASDLTAASWKVVPMGGFGTPGAKTEQVRLENLDAVSGKIAVVRISLAGGANDNAANGGKVTVQARFDGTAID